MKQFAVSASVRLTEQPVWLAAFRAKYNQRYDFHVTLKQPCSITEAEVPEVRRRFDLFFGVIPDRNSDDSSEAQDPESRKHGSRIKPGMTNKNQPFIKSISVDFNELVIDGPTDDDACIMFNVADNPTLIDLQREVVDIFGEFRDYRKPELEGYERNFRPHLTLIHNLEPVEFARARAEVQADYRCQGVIEEIVLAIVPDAAAEATLNPRNLTVAKL